MSRRLIISLMIVALFATLATPAFARGRSRGCIGCDYYDAQEDPMGVGADVVLWQNSAEKPIIQEVVAEVKQDIHNEQLSVFGVVRVNLWEMFKGDE